MQNKGFMLAEIPGFGGVFDCGNCGNLHLSVGAVSVTLTTEAYMQLVALLNNSAANFEMWRHHANSGSADRDSQDAGLKPRAGSSPPPKEDCPTRGH